MTRVALSLHLFAVVLAVRAITVAASLPSAVLRREGPASALTASLHRTCRVHGVVGLAAPAFGLITAARLDVLTETRVRASTGLTLAAALLPGGGRRLAGVTGGSSVLWAAVPVLVAFRPGSGMGA